MSTSDADIAVLKSKVEDLEENQAILFDRCRANEKWIAGAGAVIAAVIALAAIIDAVDAKTRTEVNQVTTESTRMCLS